MGIVKGAKELVNGWTTIEAPGIKIIRPEKEALEEARQKGLKEGQEKAEQEAKKRKQKAEEEARKRREKAEREALGNINWIERSKRGENVSSYTTNKGIIDSVKH